MARLDDDRLAGAIRAAARPLRTADDFDPLMELVGDASLVFLGEATHGTHEFYRLRAELTSRLIVEKGFTAVAAEADWPDAYRVNRYVRGLAGADPDAVDALSDFRRFPAWMWRNADVLDFIGWLRELNDGRAPAGRVGFYGLDLYSLHGSIAAVLRHLDEVDPEAAQRARYRYGCFEALAEDPQGYGYAGFGLARACEEEVVAQLRDLVERRSLALRRDGMAREDEQFEVEQNARVVKNAEAYYRSMFRGRVSSWNLRDTHMADTLEELRAHLARRVDRPRIVVWAHNSHVGDARATDTGTLGEIAIGQLARERHPGDAILIGFTTHAGTVTAASDWGGPAERKQVRPALPGSYEALFHEVEVPRFSLVLRDLGELTGALHEPRLHRAIGVIYRPETERMSHYLHARLPLQFDAVVHVDQTRAVEALERTAEWERGEAPETYPTGV